MIYSEGRSPLDKSIWQNLTNDLTDKRNPRIKLLEISETDRIECRRIINYGSGLVASLFDRKITFSSILKTSTGYSVKFQCKKKKACNSSWRICINLTNNQVNVKCNRLCSHLLLIANGGSESKIIFF